MAEQNEVLSVLNQIKNQEEKIKFVEEAFTRDLHEAASMIGRNVLGFATHILSATEEISDQAIVQESRTAQETHRLEFPC